METLEARGTALAARSKGIRLAAATAAGASKLALRMSRRVGMSPPGESSGISDAEADPLIADF
jgi:hypothetical protein